LNTNENDNNSTNRIFNGVVVSAIDLNEFGQVLQSQLSTKYGSTLGMIDRNGMILYSSNATYIGKDIFGDEFQPVIPVEIRDTFNSFLRNSLEGTAGSGDVTFQGNTSTIAYEPVSFSGDNFAVVYIVVPHNIQGAVGSLIDQQRDFNLIVIGLIGAFAVGIAYLVLVWNRRLSGIVKSKTAELEQANKSLQEALEQLKDHDRMQREFINVAAHELRTPTQAIIGYSDLFYLRPESRELAIKAIARNAERLERLTHDILDVTRIEGHRLDLNKEKFDVSEVVASAIEDTKRRVDDNNDSIKFQYTPRKIVVEADRMRISQVVSNLLGNAVKFTKQGTVYISADSKDGEAIVSVKDSGTGIDPEIVSRLFTKFTSKSQTGTGLGLFISKSIIEAHGGRIWAENNKDSKGATFTFRMPLEA
jgi:signal transduction histidine kinase